MILSIESLILSMFVSAFVQSRIKTLEALLHSEK